MRHDLPGQKNNPLRSSGFSVTCSTPNQHQHACVLSKFLPLVSEIGINTSSGEAGAGGGFAP